MAATISSTALFFVACLAVTPLFGGSAQARGNVRKASKFVWPCHTASGELECGRGAYGASCRWGDGQCKKKCTNMANCNQIIFYNRVPKTGSTTLWKSIADAAERSNETGKPLFKWLGHKFHDSNTLILPHDTRSMKKKLFCHMISDLAAQAPGAYALHTQHIDLDKARVLFAGLLCAFAAPSGDSVESPMFLSYCVPSRHY